MATFQESNLEGVHCRLEHIYSEAGKNVSCINKYDIVSCAHIMSCEAPLHKFTNLYVLVHTSLVQWTLAIAKVRTEHDIRRMP